jgi:hypothetical protein
VIRLIEFEPKYVTVESSGALTASGTSALTRSLVADRLPEERIEDFLDDFEAYLLDEVTGAYKPYDQVIDDALRRAADGWGIEHREEDARAIYEAGALSPSRTRSTSTVFTRRAHRNHGYHEVSDPAGLPPLLGI